MRRKISTNQDAYASQEKVAIAEQSHSLVDDICKRLNADLGELEKLLQSAGEFQAPDLAKPNDLAAVQVTAGSNEWILAKVITHDSQSGMYRLSDEDTESNKSKSFLKHTVKVPF